MGAFTMVAIMMQLSGASGLAISVLEKKVGLAPRKGYINEGKPIDTLKLAVETKIESLKEVKKVNKESFSSSPVMHFPPLRSSGTQTFCGICSHKFCLGVLAMCLSLGMLRNPGTCIECEAIVIHGFQLLDIWIHHMSGNNSFCERSKLFDM